MITIIYHLYSDKKLIVDIQLYKSFVILISKENNTQRF